MGVLPLSKKESLQTNTPSIQQVLYSEVCLCEYVLMNILRKMILIASKARYQKDPQIKQQAALVWSKANYAVNADH